MSSFLSLFRGPLYEQMKCKKWELLKKYFDFVKKHLIIPFVFAGILVSGTIFLMDQKLISPGLAQTVTITIIILMFLIIIAPVPYFIDTEKKQKGKFPPADKPLG